MQRIYGRNFKRNLEHSNSDYRNEAKYLIKNILNVINWCDSRSVTNGSLLENEF